MAEGLITTGRFKRLKHLVDSYLSRRVRPLLIEWLIILLPAWFDRSLQWLTKQQMLLLAVCLMMFAWPIMTARPTIFQQGLVALALLGIGQVLLRLEDRQTSQRVSEYLHLLLAALSTITTLRYFYYRSTSTLNLDTWLDGFFSLLLFIAELYAIATLFLSYFQTLKIRDRKSIPLDRWPQEQWPSVDIYIPTYNEDVDIVRKTVIGALNIDYPTDKKTVYVLDDGRAEKYQKRRLALRTMCQDLGCEMLTRENNEHAKAGNINTALKRTDGQLVLILDCDHIPVRGFLQETLGFFFDKKVALVQTPHWFYN
ncbi:MAG: glycosyltransferase, partial [Cyanobacteria bacterium P01_D01_bin.2]